MLHSLPTTLVLFLVTAYTILLPETTTAAPVGRSLVKRGDFSQSSGPHFRFVGGESDIAEANRYKQYKAQGAGKIERVQVIGWANDDTGTISEVYDTITDHNEPDKMNQNLFDGVNLDLTFTRVDVSKFKSESKSWAYRLFYVNIPAAALGGGSNYGVEHIDSSRMPMDWWG